MPGPDPLSARIEQWRPDLLTALARLYPDPETVAARLVDLVHRAHADRPDELRALDERRLAEPDWFQRPDALGYAAYTDRFAGTLAGVGEHVGHLAELGVTYLHLMPLLQPRDTPNDGGYAVQDYRRVRPDLGTVDDLRDLTGTLRQHGISLCLDLVLNHVAREHEWAVAARAGDVDKREYFHVFTDRALPDAYERSLPEVFPAFAPGNFTWDTDLAGWVWTTFHDYQWDLNWGNPAVLEEFADIILTLANLGVEVFRLDAIAFLWKRLDTSCQNQPEVHDLTQALRTVVRMAAPAVLFKAEAIVGPADLPAYLGTGPHAGKVSDLAYHNSLMVQVWSMLASRDVTLATRALQRLPQPPSTTSWVTYLRCHDDIGWAIDDGDAWSVGLNGAEHRRFLSDWYSGEFPGSWARGLVFQDNALTGDRRISGSLASLAGLECGDPWAVDRILLGHAVILGFGGLPIVWMGDELGLLNDLDWAGGAHPRGRQPVGAPAADAVAARTGRPRHRPGPRPPGAGTTPARSPARLLPDRDLGPPRPRGAAHRAPPRVGTAARRVQRHAGRPAGAPRGARLARADLGRGGRPPVRRGAADPGGRRRAGAVPVGLADHAYPVPVIELRTPTQIEQMRPAGRFVADVLTRLAEVADVGVNLLDLDRLAHDMIRERGAESCYIDYHPSFGAMPFGHVLCTSVNDAVLHGLPHDYTLADGDLLSPRLRGQRRRLGVRLGGQHGGRHAARGGPAPHRGRQPGARRRHRRGRGGQPARRHLLRHRLGRPRGRAVGQPAVRRPRRRPHDARRPARLQRRPARPRVPAQGPAW